MICMYTSRWPGLFAFLKISSGENARLSRIGPPKSMQIRGSYPQNYAQCRSGEKSTKIHEARESSTRESLGCTRLVSANESCSCARAWGARGESCSTRAAVLAVCNGKAGAPGVEMTRGKKLYTKSTCIVRDVCRQIHLRPGYIKHRNTGKENARPFYPDRCLRYIETISSSSFFFDLECFSNIYVFFFCILELDISSDQGSARYTAMNDGGTRPEMKENDI